MNEQRFKRAKCLQDPTKCSNEAPNAYMKGRIQLIQRNHLLRTSDSSGGCSHKSNISERQLRLRRPPSSLAATLPTTLLPSLPMLRMPSLPILPMLPLLSQRKGLVIRLRTIPFNALLLVMVAKTPIALQCLSFETSGANIVRPFSL